MKKKMRTKLLSWLIIRIQIILLCLWMCKILSMRKERRFIVAMEVGPISFCWRIMDFVCLKTNTTLWWFVWKLLWILRSNLTIHLLVTSNQPMKLFLMMKILKFWQVKSDSKRTEFVMTWWLISETSWNSAMKIQKDTWSLQQDQLIQVLSSKLLKTTSSF